MTVRTGALLIHGLGGTQFDLGSMHRQLKRCGIETHSLTLPGHGTTPEALVSVRAEAWIDAVTTKYRELVEQYEVFHVMGMCMGALLAAALCARERHDKGSLVTLAPPIYIDGWSTPWWRGVRHLAYRLPILPAKMKIEEGEPFGIKNALVRNIVKAKFERGDNFHYRWVPLACIREVDRLRRRVKRDLPLISCPTLVVHAREDELTSLKSAQFIASKARDARIVVLENSYHMICVDNDREQVVSSVLDFFGIAPQPVTTDVVIEPCTPEQTRSLVERFERGMRERRYEDVFGLFSADVHWHQRGESPVARVYGDRNALIDLFSQFVTLSDGTFRVTGFGTPEFDADGTVRMRLFSEAQARGATLAASGVLRLAFGNARIRSVVYEPDRGAEEDAFWSAAARAAQGSDEHVESDASLTGAALAADFEKAVASVSALAVPLPPAVLLKLRALYKQAGSGDVSGERPGMSDVVGRAKYDAWKKLCGMPREDAMSRYVAYARSLTQR
ncbi:acyl-CoA-binding protein [Paraburkholderia acidisoli]|uniref:Alpha/beta fold hydrolase n=1 Tax=Paraburkholderia acidisoli TaxID=2571748 RepID=A0A7Z2JER9_9BURK|nr:acyl-CoA-binding protein [Paraburkholderia acidisoli]QGZ62572.1 alpha/beta fold hydrolase [Paraburkholderia acidisoli]